MERSPLFLHSPVPVLLVDRRGRVAAVNDAAQGLLSRPRELVVGSPLQSWIVENDMPALAHAVRTARAGSPETGSVRFRTARGRTSLRRVTAAAADGGHIALFAAQAASGSSEDRDACQVADFLETLPRHFLAVLDRRGRVSRATGVHGTHLLEERALLGGPFSRLTRDDETTLAQVEAMEAAVLSGEAWRGLMWHRRSDGHAFLVRIWAAPRRDPDSGALDGAFVSGLDVDPLRRETERAEEAERMAAVGAVTGEAVRRIVSGLDEALALLPPPGEEPAADAAGGPRGRLQELRTLVERLDELATGPTLTLREVGCADVVLRELARRKAALDGAGIEVSVDAPDTSPTMVIATRPVAGAVGALLDNAIENARRGEKRWIRVTVEPSGGRLVVQVRDGGPSLSADKVDWAMEPFASDKPGHLGLGLSVARSLAVLVRGRIRVRNEETEDGETTVFSLELPLEAGEAVSGRRVGRGERRGPDRQGRSVLVVEDDAALRASTRKFFEKAGYEVSEAWSGRSAMARVTGGRLPDVVVTDLKMLDGSGYWLVEELSSYFPELLQRTVIITGDVDQPRAREMAARVGCPLVRKPFELYALLEIVDRLAEVGSRAA